MVESHGGASMAKGRQCPTSTHVLRIVRILERHGEAVHRQRGQVGSCCRSERRVPRRARARPAAGGPPLTPPRRTGRSGPAEGWASNAPLHVTERSPRIFRVSSEFTWPAFGIPTRMPACCRTVGSETVASILPKSSGGPAYLSSSGKTVDAATVCVGNTSGAPARTAPVVAGIGAPSAVTRLVHTPLYAFARLM